MRSYTFRLTSEGFAELQKSLDDLGEKGDAALQQLERAAPGFGAAMEQAAKRAETSRQKIEATLQKEMADIARVLEQGVIQSERNFKSLQASLDPAIAAQQQLARGRDVVNDALKRGVATEQQAAQTNKQLEDQYKRSTGAVGGFATGLTSATRLLGTLGIAVSAAEVVSFGKDVFNTTAQLVDQAQQLQVSTTALQAYRAEFKQNGSSAETADKALDRVNKTIGDAVDNIGSARRELAEWNIDWRDLANAAPDQRLALVARGLLSVEDGTRRARAEQDLFGKTGRETETVLLGIADGIDQVKDRQKDFIVSEEKAREAKAAADKIAAAFDELKVSAAGDIVDAVTHVADFIDKINELNKLRVTFTWGDLGRALTGQGLAATGGAAPGHTNYVTDGNPNSAQKQAYFDGPTTTTLTNLQQYLDGLKQEAQLAGLSVQKRAEVSALLAAANEKLKDGVVYQGKAADFAGRQATSMADVNKILTPAEEAEVRRSAALKSSAEQYDKIKVTYSKFLADLQESARVAGESVQQRQSELVVIQAAQVAQRARGVQEKDIVQTYAGARKELGDIRTAEVEAATAAKSRNEFARDILGPLRDEASLADLTRDARGEELEVLRLKQQYGEQAVNLSEQELRNLLKQRDLTVGSDMIADLREQVSLAGLTADEAERQEAVLQAMHATHGNLSADQASELRNLVDQRHAAEQLRDTAQDVDDVLENWLETGKASLSDLSNVFKRELAQMTAQALLHPLVVPIVAALSPTQAGVQSLLGLGGVTGGGASGGAGAALGLGDIGGVLASGTNWLGSSLGFASTLPAVTAGGISIGATNVAGSLFGSTTLGGALGMAGMGSMIGGMMGGNPMVSGALGMAGSLAGGALLGSTLGSFAGPAGMLAGALLGAALGDMGASNKSSTASFTNNGLSAYLAQSGSQASTQSVNQASSLISSVMSTLQQAGFSVGMGGVTGVNIGQEKSYLYTANGGKQKFGANDIDGVVQAALSRILPTATGGSADSQAILGKYLSSGGINANNLSQFQSDLGFAQTLRDLDLGTKNLSASEQALKQINDQYQSLIDKASALGLATGDIESARQGAIQSLIDGFDDSVQQSILQITDPNTAAMAALKAQQDQRIKDATTLGADLNDVYRLNALETKALTDAQQQQADAQAAQAAALAQQAAAMNLDVRNQILSFSDAQGAALAEEDRQAQQRIDAAREVGADLVQVEKLNALSRQKVVDDYAAQVQQQAQAAAALNEQTRIQILGFTDNLQASLAAEDQAGQQRIAAAKAAGADLVQVEQLNALSRQKVADDFADQAAQTAAQQAQAIADLNEQTRISILGFTDAQAAALATEDDAAKQRIAAAKAAGADLVQVEKLNALSRQKVLDDFAAQAAQQANQLAQSLDAAKTSLSGLVNSLLTGSDSPLSPDQQYFALLTRYNDTKRAALTAPSNATAIGAFQSAASSLIPVAREFLGTSQSYGSLSNDIISTATQLGGDLSDPSGLGRAMVAATTQGSGAIVDALGVANDRLGSMGDDMKKLSALMQAVINRSTS